MPYPLLVFLAFIVLLGPIMILHELGHYWAARRAGIRVEEFGLGIPPRAVRLFKRGETEFTLNWLPFGAFVKMTGENPSDNHSDPHAFSNASLGGRALTIFAGPLMNFITAIVVLFSANLFVASKPVLHVVEVQSVNPGSPAQGIGLLPGDLLIQVNGKDVTLDEAGMNALDAGGIAPLSSEVRRSIGSNLELLVDREGKLIPLSGLLTPGAKPEAPLGISLNYRVTKTERLNLSVGDAFDRTTRDLWMFATLIPRTIKAVIDGILPLWVLRPSSPLAVAEVGAQVIQRSFEIGPFDALRFFSLLSMMVGISNLLPFPALDGGRLLFLGIEWLRRGKRVDPAREQWVHGMGMMLLLGSFFIFLALDIFMPIVRR